MEDHAGDVVGKAARGLGLSRTELSARLGMPMTAWPEVLSGTGSPEHYQILAAELGLARAPLEALRAGAWRAPEVQVPWFTQLNLECEDMRVNVYLAVDPVTRDAIVFDSGEAAAPVLDACDRLGARVRELLLTHEHWDHVEAAPELSSFFGLVPRISQRAPGGHGEPFGDEARWTVGSFQVRAVPTPGHAAGGTTFVIEGPGATVAVVGDALFAASMGGTATAYALARERVRTGILSLPDAVIVAPGHGPLTTVGWERANNPFFAGE